MGMCPHQNEVDDCHFFKYVLIQNHHTSVILIWIENLLQNFLIIILSQERFFPSCSTEKEM